MVGFDEILIYIVLRMFILNKSKYFKAVDTKDDLMISDAYFFLFLTENRMLCPTAPSLPPLLLPHLNHLTEGSQHMFYEELTKNLL